MGVRLALTVALIALTSSACVTLSSRLVDARSPGKKLASRTETERVEDSSLQLTDVDYRAGNFSARVIHAATCDVSRYERVAEIHTRYTSYPASPWTMIGAEAALSAATLLEGGICSAGSDACAGISVNDRGAAGSVLLGLGAAVALTALVDVIFVATRDAPTSEIVEREKPAKTSRETCTVRPLRDKVGLVTYGGASKHFLTDDQGRFMIGDTQNPRTRLHLEVDDEAVWLDLAKDRR